MCCFEEKIFIAENVGNEKRIKKSMKLPVIPTWGFPDGSVVKNPPANAGDGGLIPDPGRSHMPWSS